MRTHYLQHVPFEGLGSIESWLRERDAVITATRLYEPHRFPDLADFDRLIVMGGPMGVHDASFYPWLAPEKAFLKAAMDAGKVVLGICLGAQLIADALGAAVEKNAHREIGWFPVTRATEAERTIIGPALPERFEAFHWHGDRFHLPDRAIPLASSEACPDQGFILDNRVVGLQFHLETTPISAAALVENCGGELDGSRFVQSAADILSDSGRFDTINTIMADVLTRLETALPTTTENPAGVV